jgi:hypothetical protein
MFNLSKHSQSQVGGLIDDAGDTLGEGMENPESLINEPEDIVGDPNVPGEEDKQRLLDLTQDEQLIKTLNDLQGQYPSEVKAIREYLDNNDKFQQLKRELVNLPGDVEKQNLQTLTPQVPTFNTFQDEKQKVLNTVRRLNSITIEQQKKQPPIMQFQQPQQIAAFNLKKVKAQMQEAMPPQAPPQPTQPQQSQSRFPVKNAGDFIDKFLEPLVNNNNQPGTPQYEQARLASEELRKAISPGFEEEANSIVESVMNLDPTQKEEGQRYLLKLYEVLLAPVVKQENTGMESVMSEKEPIQVIKQASTEVDGIIRYSFTDQILTNADNQVVKTAADQFGQQYLLYGPTEKRICPKLRGKNMSVGDVVSEYTCRHHCLDGIVIDDNKTICGEALWRANSMDKFSRDYVDADGNLVGGYLNKRFEINRNVPEENKMRLKPGELRKPRPAAWGNTESRLQDMRSKEADKRDYRPDSNTGDAFDWAKDVDQNNVQVSQKTRDQRETNSGHQLVEYSNKTELENKPKVAFNLSKMKKIAHFGQEENNPPVDNSINSPIDSSPNTVDQILQEAEELVRQLKAQGWTQEQFAQELGKMFNEENSGAEPSVNEPPFNDQSPKPMLNNNAPLNNQPKPMFKNPMASKTAQTATYETQYDFQAGEERARNMSDYELSMAIKDLQEVIAIQNQTFRQSQTDPNVNPPHKLNYYYDELHTYARELNSRRSAFNLKNHKLAGKIDLPKKKN